MNDRQKSGSKARRKGKNGELEAVHFLGELGIFARRGVQYDGSQGAADIIGPKGVHIEVKRYAKMTQGLLNSALDQSARDAKGDIPIVMWRQDRGPWCVSLTCEAFGRVTGMPMKREEVVQMSAVDFWTIWKEVRP